MPRIVVQNAQRKLRVNVAHLQQFSEHALALCLGEKAADASGLQALEEVHVILVSDARIAALHRKFMNIGGPTDVITFQHGEIFISVETALLQAAELRTPVEDELRLYIVHGLLHLHGFHDTTEVARAAMHRVQTRVAKAAARLN